MLSKDARKLWMKKSIRKVLKSRPYQNYFEGVRDFEQTALDKLMEHRQRASAEMQKNGEDSYFMGRYEGLQAAIVLITELKPNLE
jgi:hypothetical protein